MNRADTSASRVSEQFTLLANAIAGRPVSVQLRNVPVAYTDGSVVYLPPTDHASSLVSVMVQCSLIGAGSLDAHVLRRLVGRPKQARRYVTLEAARAHAQLGVVQPRHLRAAIREHWQGEIPLTAYDSLRRATSRELIPPAPVEFGTVRPSAVLRARFGAVGDVRATQAIAILHEVDPADEVEGDDEDIGNGTGQEKSNLAFMSGLLAALLGRKLKGTFKQDGNDGGLESGGLGLVTRSLRPLSEYARLVRNPTETQETRAFGSKCGLLYHEWDVRSRRYRSDWCTVDERDAPTGYSEPPRLPIDHRLRRGLLQLGMTRRRHNRQPIGDGLDTSALVDFAISAHLGERSTEDVYEARLRTNHDLGVVVLLDASGSTSDPSGSGAMVWDQQRALTESLVSGMEQVGHRVAAVAFRSWGRHQVNLLKIKDFDVRWGAGPRSRLFALDPAGFTRMGAAIRHACHLLTTSAGTGRRLLVVVSDGYAYDEDGYVDR